MYVGGFRVHHLFTGALIQIVSAFLLAFGARTRRAVLVVFTDGSNEAYRAGSRSSAPSTPEPGAARLPRPRDFFSTLERTRPSSHDR